MIGNIESNLISFLNLKFVLTIKRAKPKPKKVEENAVRIPINIVFQTTPQLYALYKQSIPQIPLLTNLFEKFNNWYEPSGEIKALLNIVKIGKNTNNETKIIINQILPTMKLSPLSQPLDDNPWVI